MKALEPKLSDELHAQVTSVTDRAHGLQRDAAAARAADRACPGGVCEGLTIWLSPALGPDERDARLLIPCWALIALAAHEAAAQRELWG